MCVLRISRNPVEEVNWVFPSSRSIISKGTPQPAGRFSKTSP